MVEIQGFSIFVFLSSWVFLSNFLEIQFKCVFMQVMIEINSLSMYKQHNTYKTQEKTRIIITLTKTSRTFRQQWWTWWLSDQVATKVQTNFQFINFYRFWTFSTSSTQIQAQIQDSRNFKNRVQNWTKPLILIWTILVGDLCR